MRQPFDLNLILIFAALHRTRSTKIAGEELGISQSGVSNALARMRRIFDDPLFVSTPRGMMPTPLAEKLVEPFDGALRLVWDAVDRPLAFDPQSSDRAFRLYMSDVGQAVFLPELLDHARRNAPRVKFSTIQAPAGQARDEMVSGNVDLAIGFFLDQFGAGFHRHILFQERFVCLLGARHPCVETHLSVADFFNTGHVLFRPAAGSHGIVEILIDRFARENGLERRIVLDAAHALGLQEILSSTDLIAVVPSRFAGTIKKAARLAVRPIPFETPTFDVATFWHERVRRDPGNVWLRTLFGTLFRTESHSRILDSDLENH